MHLHEFLHLTHNVELLWNFLCEKEVVRRDIMCPRCQKLLLISVACENHLIHCTNKYYKTAGHKKRQRVTCNFKISALHGTFFSKVHLNLPAICRFIAYFVIMDPPRQAFIMNELHFYPNTVVDWTNFCREVMHYSLYTFAHATFNM